MREFKITEEQIQALVDLGHTELGDEVESYLRERFPEAFDEWERVLSNEFYGADGRYRLFDGKIWRRKN